MRCARERRPWSGRRRGRGWCVRRRCPELFEANRALRLARAEKALHWALFSCVLWAGLLVLLGRDGLAGAWKRFAIPFLMFGLVPAAANALGWRRARRWTPELMAREAPLARFQSWVAERRATAT